MDSADSTIPMPRESIEDENENVYLQNQINLELNLELYRSALADYESADSRRIEVRFFLEKRKSISLVAWLFVCLL